MAKLIATDYDGLRKACLRKGGGATIGNNTHALLMDEVVGVRLHGHLIAMLHPDGRVAIRDCGWVTTTTYDRLMQLVPAGWRVNRKGGQGTTSFNKELCSPIFPGEWVILCPDGTLGAKVAL